MVRSVDWIFVVLLALSASSPAFAQDGKVIAVLGLGKNYREIPQQPVANAAKIEVIDFFFYGCPYCNELRPTLERWRASLPADVAVMADPGRGLNAAAAAALAAADGKASRLILIHGDLPLVTARDIELLAAAPAGEIAIAPDRHGTGTNAISLPLPAARGFSFAFGTDSFARHNAEAGRMGLGISEVHSPGLSRDVDEPDDLQDAADLLKQAG